MSFRMDGWKRKCSFLFFFLFKFDFILPSQQLRQKWAFQPNSLGHQLSGTGEEPYDTAPPSPLLLPLTQSDPVQFLISEKNLLF